MGYKRTTYTTYLIGFPAGGFVKVGYSERQRWRSFRAGGGEVILLHHFSDDLTGCRAALALETEIETYLRSRYPRAFESKGLAAPFLGNRGAGYRECYRVADSKSMAEPYGKAVDDLMARYGTVRNGTERIQAPAKSSCFSDARTPVDKGSSTHPEPRTTLTTGGGFLMHQQRRNAPCRHSSQATATG